MHGKGWTVYYEGVNDSLDIDLDILYLLCDADTSVSSQLTKNVS